MTELCGFETRVIFLPFQGLTSISSWAIDEQHLPSGWLYNRVHLFLAHPPEQGILFTEPNFGLLVLINNADLIRMNFWDAAPTILVRSVSTQQVATWYTLGCLLSGLRPNSGIKFIPVSIWWTPLAPTRWHWEPTSWKLSISRDSFKWLKLTDSQEVEADIRVPLHFCWYVLGLMLVNSGFCVQLGSSCVDPGPIKATTTWIVQRSKKCAQGQ